MKAIAMLQAGAANVLNLLELPTPVPQKNHVLVKLSYAALNHVDIWLRQGSPAYPVEFPHVMGGDGSGVIEAVGPEAEGIEPGARVLIFPGIACGACDFCRRGQDNQCEQYFMVGAKKHGTYAEYVSVPDSNIVVVPDDYPLDAAAAFPLAYLTTWHMIFGKAQLKSKETVVVNGAGSGIGVAAIQLAKWKGARILALTTSRSKSKKLQEIGAEDVLVVDKDSDSSKWVLEKTGGRGADVVVEHVGPATWDNSLKSLARYGRLVTCGATTGPTVNLDLRFLFSRDISLFGSRLGTQREFQSLCQVMFKKEFMPVIDRVFPLKEASSAHDYLEGKQHVGKILLKI